MRFQVIEIADTDSIFAIGYIYWTETLPDLMLDESFTGFAPIDIAKPTEPTNGRHQRQRTQGSRAGNDPA